jgi:16S rRNA C967 or C1407 C5-methylase (RsmB/RsmF family)/NOL1/NOP2/fmu family ribosome biogenesis protein
VSKRKAGKQSKVTKPAWTEKAIRIRQAAALGRARQQEIPFSVDPVPWFEAGRFAKETAQPGRYLQHAAGAYFVQDAGSMLALKLLAAQPHEVIADVCAAPGGKATSILETVGPGTGFLLANEPIRGRMAALQWTLGRVGFSRYATCQYDVEQLAERLAGCFDKVLVDAPCSGQTLVGRGKQSTSAFEGSQVQHSAARQKRIILAAAQLVRPGGRLVYSTCTFATEENEQVAQFLIDEDNRWKVVEVAELQEWASQIDPGGYRLWPEKDRCAGAYAICLELSKADAEIQDALSISDQNLSIPSYSSLKKSGTASGVGGRLPSEVGDVLELAGGLENFASIGAGRQWFGIPSDAPDWLEQIHFSGSEIAYQPAKVWLPAHALGLRRESSWQARSSIELDDSEAQRYLQGLTLEAREPGWSVVHWQGHPLGWIHSNLQRANNSLPQAARLPYVAPVN